MTKGRATRNKRRRGSRANVPQVELDNEKFERSDEPGEELLPGIPDEIILIHITPKLPWRSFPILSSLSRGWKRALRTSHQSYDERVRSHITETLAVVDLTLSDDDSHAIALYSVSDERFYYVPPIPGFRGFPMSCECISLDGKLYVLGGVRDASTQLGRDEVYVLDLDEMYVLDLAGERQWRQCASMKEGRQEFACGVMDGKIYVFGGSSKYEPVRGSEVYDPKLNAWSSIPPPPAVRFQHRVTTVRNALFLHGGKSYSPDYFDWKRGGGVIDFVNIRVDHPLEKYIEDAWLLEGYNPVTKKWGVDNNFPSTGMDIVSGTDGTFYSISWQSIHAHHVDHRLWIPVSSFSVENILPRRSASGKPFVVALADGELTAVVHWLNIKNDLDESCLVRSRGFSSGNNSKVSWEKAPWSGKYSSHFLNRIMCCIQL